MGKWLDLGMTFEDTLDHMERLGIRKALAETILQIEQGLITGDIEEDSRPGEALDRFFLERPVKS